MCVCDVLAPRRCVHDYDLFSSSVVVSDFVVLFSLAGRCERDRDIWSVRSDARISDSQRMLARVIASSSAAAAAATCARSLFSGVHVYVIFCVGGLFE